MGINWRDIALRALIVVAGAVAATLLVLRGQTTAVPALAIGAMAGSLMMGRTGSSEG